MPLKTLNSQCKLWSFLELQGWVHQQIKGSGSFMVKKPCELITTEHFLNILDHENFFPKEILIDFFQDNSVSRNIAWNMML